MNHFIKRISVCIFLTLIVSIALTGCGSDDNSVSKSTEAATDSNTEDVTEVTKDTDETEDALYSETKADENETLYVDTSTYDSNVEDTTPDTNEEVALEGNKDNPYLEIPTSELTVTTVKIPSGKTLYYDIYRVGGMIFTIKDSSAYVIYNGIRYDAKNGKVSFKVENALASDAISFEIGNNGSTDKSFLISFSSPMGTYSNPEIIEKLDNEIEISLPEGNDIGYYYKYISEKEGTIRFYMSATTDSVILATNNRNSAQRTSEEDILTDENGDEYIELEVIEGDEIIINVGAKPTKRGKYPATDITWSGKYN